MRGESGERARLRGTGAHNTMQVDECDQAEATGPFSWKTSPRVNVEQWITGQQFDLFKGSHDGYSRLSSPVLHRRWVFHRKGEFWMVRDLAEGGQQGPRQLSIAWNLGAGMSPRASQEYLFTGEAGSLALLTAEGHGWSQSVSRELWSPAYGRAERASVVTFGTRTELPADFATLLLAGESLSPDLGSTDVENLDLGNLVRIPGSASGKICAYRYVNGRHEHCFFFADQPGPWALGKWTSDAEFLYASFDRERDAGTLILCNGSYAEAGGQRVLVCGKRVSYVEVVNAAKKVEIFSSDPEEVTLQQPLARVWAETDLIVPGEDSKGTGV